MRNLTYRVDRNKRADPLIQHTVVFKHIRIKNLNSSGYGGTSRLTTRGPQHSPDLFNDSNLHGDQSSSLLFPGERQSRPFSTQGYNNEFSIITSLGNPVTGRLSTLEPLNITMGKTQSIKKGRSNKPVKPMWKTVGKSQRLAGANKSVDDTALAGMITEFDKRRGTA